MRLSMNVKRTATLVVVGGAAAAWLYAAASATRESATVPIGRRPAVDARGEALASEVARLHDRLHPNSTPKQPGRNLFQFTTAHARSQPVVQKPALSEAVVVAAAAPSPFKLVGIAEDAGPDGPVRTAIVSAPGQLFLVKTGENVTLRYRVSKISAEVLELTDVGDGSILRLALK